MYVCIDSSTHRLLYSASGSGIAARQPLLLFPSRTPGHYLLRSPAVGDTAQANSGASQPCAESSNKCLRFLGGANLLTAPDESRDVDFHNLRPSTHRDDVELRRCHLRDGVPKQAVAWRVCRVARVSDLHGQDPTVTGAVVL